MQDRQVKNNSRRIESSSSRNNRNRTSYWRRPQSHRYNTHDVNTQNDHAHSYHSPSTEGQVYGSLKSYGAYPPAEPSLQYEHRPQFCHDFVPQMEVMQRDTHSQGIAHNQSNHTNHRHTLPYRPHLGQAQPLTFVTLTITPNQCK